MKAFVVFVQAAPSQGSSVKEQSGAVGNSKPRAHPFLHLSVGTHHGPRVVGRSSQLLHIGFLHLLQDLI